MALSPVRNSVERFFFSWFFMLIPAAYLLRLGVQYIEYDAVPALLDTVKIAAESALLILLTCADVFLAAIGPTIDALFANGVVSRFNGEDADRTTTQAACERAIDDRLNHGARIGVAAAAALITSLYYVTRLGGLSAFVSTGSFLRGLDIVLYVLPTICYAYFVGLLAWKLAVTSLFFRSFPERYGVIPRFLHPDGAWGVLAVGDLCLKMMFVPVAPTVLSALLLIAYFAPHGFLAYLTANRILLVGFTPLMLSAGVVGLLIGLLPLLKFHLAIMERQDERIRQLARLAERIITEKDKLLTAVDHGASVDSIVKTVTELQSHYDRSRRVRTWPVDGRLVAGIWGSVGIVGGQLIAFIEIVRKFMPNAGSTT